MPFYFFNWRKPIPFIELSGWLVVLECPKSQCMTLTLGDLKQGLADSLALPVWEYVQLLNPFIG